MYSVVLMAALATSATPAWCHRQASCHSCYGCYGGYAGYAGYSGYAGYGCYGCHGCHGPVGYGAAGGCYGYHGGCYGAFGIVHADAYQGSCYGCHGGHSGYGVALPVQVAPVVPKMPAKDPFPPINPKKDPAGEEIPKPKEKAKQETSSSRVKIRIEVPEGGKLFIDSRPLNVAAGTRIFQTPELVPGETYFYDIRIEIDRNGIRRGEEQRVVIQAGQDAFVSFPTLRPAAPSTAQVRP